MKISKHGSKRLKERVGLPKRAHGRHIKIVLGYKKNFTVQTSEKFQIIYNGFIYIFTYLEKQEPILITTIKVKIMNVYKHKYRNQILKFKIRNKYVLQ